MKRLWSGKRKKSSELPQQPIPPGKPMDTTAGPAGFREQQDISLGDERGRVNYQAVSQDGMDEDEEFPASENLASAFVISGTDHGNKRTVESTSDDTKGGGIEPGGVSRIAKRPRRRTLLVGAKEAAEKFGPLKVVLEAIPASYANRKGTVTAGKTEGLLSRIVALEKRFDSFPGDLAEQRHRDGLIREFKRIERQLQLLSGKSGLQLHSAQDDEDTLELLEDLQEAILRYQTVQQATSDDQVSKRVDPADATILNNFRCAQQAEHRHGDRNGCLKGTRRAILDEIEFWICGFEEPPVYWLNGLAGTGKSTIAQTIAERAFADGRLGASFFCSRDFEDRSNLQLIFPTLAVQLARRYTEFRSIFVPLVQSDPGIAHESLYGQMKKLLVQPLVKSAISTVIVIDALDECKDEEPASAILSVLGQFVTEVPMVKFFVTGRPEPRIREGFRLPLLAKATDVFVLHEVEPSQVNKDIRLFFRHSFSELKRRRLGLENWPTEEQLYQICERTAGLFVHAMATVRFLDKKNNNPKRQLDRLLQSPESSVFEGKTKFKGMTTLDSLYTSILQGAFGDDDPEDDHRIQSVLGAIILATNPLSPSTIAALLGFEVEDVFPLLLSVHSLLVLQEDTDRPVQPFHKSFPDFIVDPARCSNPRFRISPADQHSKLLIGCLELMNLRLEQNMCKLPDLVTNAEVDDLEDRAERHIDRALQYACRSWYKHLVNTVPGHITPVLHRFLEKKFLFWLEVLSVLGAAREAVDALQVTAKWLNVSPTLDLVRDYFRFLIAFFEVISTSAPHIYHSALPLSPRTSIVRELYKQYARPLTRVTRGLPTSWEPIVATMYRSDFRGEAAWSPCNRFIAVATTKNVEIFDAVTLKRLKTFECPTGPGAWRLCFSPDSRFLTQFNDEGLASWDLQTGGPIGTIPPRQDMFLSDFFSPTHSVDGTMVAVAYGDPHDNTFISTYDLPSRTHIRSHRIPEGRIVTPIWTYGEYLRFVAVKRTSITVSEVPFTLAHAPVEVESLPAPNEIAGGYNFIFLPALSRLAFTFQGTILVWDAKVSKLLLKSGPLQALDFSHNPPRFPFMGSFSPDGRFFACMSATHEVYMWKETPAGYALHQKLPFVATGTPKGPLLSPNGESVIFSTRPTINLWPTEDLILSNPNAPTRDNIGQGFNLEFSPDETAAAFVRHGSDTVMTLDLQSGDPLLVIDAGMGIECLAVTGDAVVVVGEGKVVTWNLPRGNCGLTARANTNDRVQVTTYGRSQHGHSPLFRDLREPNFVSISPDLRRIVIAGNSTTTWPPSPGLEIYDVSTGWHLMEAITSTNFLKLRFAPDGREVWGVYGDSSVEGWKIIEHSRHGATLKHLEPSARPQGVFPWESPRGYGVMHDGWILSPTQKRLLWLPHYWRSDEKSRTWGGRFLGLHHRELAEVVILEFID